MKRLKLSTTTWALALLALQNASPVAAQDIVHLSDVIISGSACVGFDCVNGESFGFDTIRIKENNLRIKAQDTSSSASFPSNDWQITFNDSSNGGLNKFSIDDIDGGTTPFTIEAGAPSHSLYVDDGGRLGLGTSAPVVDAHVVTGNTPTLRLEQDGSSGFTPQTWDVAGNEANFFIRDATNGSTLPFRIRPGAPTSAIDIDGDGHVGIGTGNPDAPLDILASNANIGVGNAVIKLANSAGHTAFQLDPNDDGTFWNMSALLSNDAYRISRSGTGGPELELLSSGDLIIRGTLTTSGPTCTGGCDAVFDEDYRLPTIEEHARHMFSKKHLPAVGPTSPNTPVNLSEQMGNMLNELEKAHIYIAQLEAVANERDEHIADIKLQLARLFEQ